MKLYFCLVSILLLAQQRHRVLADNDNSVRAPDTPSDESTDNNVIVLHLDENMNRFLLDLFVEVFGNNPNNDNRIEVPVATVAEIYRNYTQEQIDSLRLELKKLDNRFDIVRRSVDSLQEKYLVSNIEYALNRDLTKYEQHFIQIGEQLLTLQKLVLKFTNSDKPIDENSSQRSGRKSPFATIFNRLFGLFLGTNTEQTTNSPQNSETTNSNQMNKLIGLLRALQSINDTNLLKSKPELLRLKTTLYQLQHIQELNRLASQRQYLNSNNLNPYGYEAVLNLVRLVGSASGQNQLRAMSRLFTPQTQNRVKNTNNISQEKLKQLMKAIEEQESRKRQQLETQRQTEILNELLRNQNRQQQQINGLIQLIESQNRNTGNNNNNNTINNNLNQNPFTFVKPTTTQTTPTSNQNEILTKLREQRRQLNNLLKTLGTDFNTTNPSNIALPGLGGQTANPDRTRDSFNNVLKSIGPMMAMLTQSGLISTNQNQLTQNSLTDLLKQTNSPNIRLQFNDTYKSKVTQFIDLLGSILHLNN